MIEITLGKGYTATIDDDDFALVRDHKWYVYQDDSGNCYAITKFPRPPGKKWQIDVRMHRLIMGAKRGEIVDHRDGNGLNNRRDNLRLCTHGQNMANMRDRESLASFKGVTIAKKTGLFHAQITHEYRQIGLGHYDRAEDAARAYDVAASKFFGEFARLNFNDGLLVQPERHKCQCGKCRHCRKRKSVA